MNILVTGGCGFIGSHFVKYWLSKWHSDNVIVLDKLTYAGKTDNLKACRTVYDKSLRIVIGDICDKQLVRELFEEYDFDYVVNFAAETHVDNSINSASEFIQTNIVGTSVLLDVAKESWKGKSTKRFLQVGTDEVYGALSRLCEPFTEESEIEPSSPYSASKASADLLALAYHKTFGLPVVITRCSNNYGSYQDYEKLIPRMIKKALNDERLPIFGDGQQVRDWLYVGDHCTAIHEVLRYGRLGEVYNVGGNNELTNIEIVNIILSELDKPTSLIEFVPDRLGHDFRYAIDATKLETELGWKPARDFKTNIIKTIKWYRMHKDYK